MHNPSGVVPFVLAGLMTLTFAACADDGSTDTTDGSSLVAATSSSAGDAAAETTVEGPGGSAPASSPDTTDDAIAPGGTLPGETSPPTPASSGPPQGSTDTVYEQGDIDSGLQPFITIAIDDLAARLGVDPGEITTLSAVLVVWPNGALGCPQPGMQFTQVPVDGSVIELGAGGRVYRYHSGGSRTPFLCDQPLAEKPPSGDIALD